MSAFTTWLARSGASFAKLRIATGGNGERFMQAAAAIQAGERILSVPEASLITVNRAKQAPVGRLLMESGASLTDAEYLTAFVLAERARRQSYFRPYLATLPAAIDHFPVSFDARALAALTGTAVDQRLVSRRRYLRGQRERLLEANPALSRWSTAEFLSAQLAVTSRAFRIGPRGESSPVLVPMADMMDHATAPDVEWDFDAQSQSFIMDAVRPLRAGDVIRNSYGAKCNCQLLLSYGFALRDNPCDRAMLRFTLPEPARLQRVQLLRSNERHAYWNFHAPPLYSHNTTFRMFWFLRVAHADNAELRRLVETSGSWEPRRMVSRANEAASLATLAAACSQVLKSLAGNEVEDAALLDDPRMPRNLRHAVMVRQGERRALQKLLELTQVAQPLLRMSSIGWQSARSAWARRDVEWGGYLSALISNLSAGF